MRAAGSLGLAQCPLDTFCSVRARSHRGRSASVGDSIPSALAGVLANEALHRRLGFQGCGVDPQGFAREPTRLVEPPEDPVADFVKERLREPLAEATHRGVNRRRFGGSQSRETPQSQAVGATPRKPALPVDPFEAPEEAQPETYPRRKARAASFPAGAGADSFDEGAKTRTGEHLLELPAKRMSGSRPPLGRRHEQRHRRLFASSQGHRCLSPSHASCSPETQGLFDGLLAVHGKSRKRDRTSSGFLMIVRKSASTRWRRDSFLAGGCLETPLAFRWLPTDSSGWRSGEQVGKGCSSQR